MFAEQWGPGAASLAVKRQINMCMCLQWWAMHAEQRGPGAAAMAVMCAASRRCRAVQWWAMLARLWGRGAASMAVRLLLGMALQV